MLSVILRFAVLGSFLGGGVFCATRDLAASLNFPSASEIVIALTSALPLAVLSSFLAVPLGVFPATITGAFYWFALDSHTKHNLSPSLRIVLGGGVGLVVSSIFGLMFSFSDAPGAYLPVVNLVSWACAGVFGGGVSALTIRDETYTLVFGRREV
ncbi:MAG: hypothetical protein WDM70_01835 [Nitrosomonadales bacterium]